MANLLAGVTIKRGDHPIPKEIILNTFGGTKPPDAEKFTLPTSAPDESLVSISGTPKIVGLAMTTTCFSGRTPYAKGLHALLGRLLNGTDTNTSEPNYCKKKRKVTVPWVENSQFLSQTETHDYSLLVRHDASKSVWYFDSLHTGRHQRARRAVSEHHRFLLTTNSSTQGPFPLKIPYVPDVTTHAEDWSSGLHAIMNCVSFLSLGLPGWDHIPLFQEKPHPAARRSAAVPARHHGTGLERTTHDLWRKANVDEEGGVRLGIIGTVTSGSGSTIRTPVGGNVAEKREEVFEVEDLGESSECTPLSEGLAALLMDLELEELEN
ncbi:hypothetical protein B0H66DRAFT_528726 [Apodospora peruviana]|uniref:Uncharacterized protein n=1 Tax=Apodospora peruviana TaxID=516989 RepID=A0AAE0IUW4_9PEZI|nr:hypothetical protein B0H66DRAFT_528726 [Apodospora peruviana]